MSMNELDSDAGRGRRPILRRDETPERERHERMRREEIGPRGRRHPLSRIRRRGGVD